MEARSQRRGQAHGTTPLMMASYVGNFPTVKLLLEVGHANVNTSREHHGDTALTMATSQKHCLHEIVPTLLEYGANVNPPKSVYYSLRSPLLNVCAFPGASHIVQKLLELGADSTVKYCGSTAMHIAARWSDEPTIRVLLAHGVSVNPGVSHDFGRTPLQDAASNGDIAGPNMLLALIYFPSKRSLAPQSSKCEKTYLPPSLHFKSSRRGGICVECYYGLLGTRIHVKYLCNEGNDMGSLF